MERPSTFENTCTQTQIRPAATTAVANIARSSFHHLAYPDMYSSREDARKASNSFPPRKAARLNVTATPRSEEKSKRLSGANFLLSHGQYDQKFRPSISSGLAWIRWYQT